MTSPTREYLKKFKNELKLLFCRSTNSLHINYRWKHRWHPKIVLTSKVKLSTRWISNPRLRFDFSTFGIWLRTVPPLSQWKENWWLRTARNFGIQALESASDCTLFSWWKLWLPFFYFLRQQKVRKINIISLPSFLLTSLTPWYKFEICIMGWATVKKKEKKVGRQLPLLI